MNLDDFVMRRVAHGEMSDVRNWGEQACKGRCNLGMDGSLSPAVRELLDIWYINHENPEITQSEP